MTINERITKLEETIEAMRKERAEWILLMTAQVHLSSEHPTPLALRLHADVREAVTVRMKQMIERVDQSVAGLQAKTCLLKEVVEYLNSRYKWFSE